MMTRLKYIIIATIGALFMLSSCADGDEITRTLDVDKSTIVMSKDANVQSVNVTVDSGVTFSATWKGGDWGSAVANVQAGVVEISVQANNTAYTRLATVVVTIDGGLRNRVIEITQNSDDIVVIPDEVTFDFMGGDFIAKVNSKIGWEAEASVEWLELTQHLEANEVVITASPNKSDFPRSTTLSFTAGTYPKEVKVIQDARPLFLLPYLNTIDATHEKLVAFEEARHSSVMKGDPSAGGQPTKAYTKSPLMPIINYDYLDESTTSLEFATIKIEDEFMPGFFGKESGDKGKVYDLLIESGFEYLIRLDYADYYWVDCGSDAKLHYLITIFASTKTILYEQKQHKPDVDAPTFDAFPYPDMKAVPWGSHQSVAKEWEAKNGGVIFEEDEGALGYNVSGSDLYRMRYYYYDKSYDDMAEIQCLFQEISQVLIRHPSNTNMLSISPALNRLIIDEGFTFAGMDGSFPIYHNLTKNLQIMVFGAYDPNFPREDEVQRGGIAYAYLDNSGRVAPSFSKILANPHLKYIPIAIPYR